MESHKYEPIIYIKDLFFVALNQWRAILAVALIGAILVGGIQTALGIKAVKSAEHDDARQEMIDQLEAQKEKMEREIADLQQKIAHHQEYLDNSVLMLLNPYEFFEAKISVYVKTDIVSMAALGYQVIDKSADILHAYKTLLCGNETKNVFSKELGIGFKYVSEVLAVAIVDNSNTLELSIKLPTEERAQQALRILEEQMLAVRDQVAEFTEHELVVVEKSVYVRENEEIAQTQEKSINHMPELKTALQDAQKALADHNAAIENSKTIKPEIKNNVLFTVLGGVLGAFFTVCVLCVMHITSDKVYAARNLTNRTGVKVLGTIGYRKKNVFDRWICRCEGRSEWDMQNSLVVVDVCCRAKQAKHLLITGSGDQKDREALVQEIAKQLPDTRVEDCGSILNSAEALKALFACDVVVLVETNGVSKYSDVEKQTEIICDYKKEILGCVLFER